jgi:ribosomal protein S18 acetylase RimI-like enzyme
VLFRSRLSHVMAETILIRKAEGGDLPAMMGLLRDCARDMQANGIDQWDENYPPEDVVHRDIAAGTAYVCAVEGHVAGMFAMDENQSPEYEAVGWRLTAKRIAVIHRLAVSPTCRRQGIASQLMDFAESQAAAMGYDVIRLDTYSRNFRSMSLFPGRGYLKAGQVHFRGKPIPFYCFEKALR